MAQIDVVSDCFKAFINVLTARARQQFKALLYSYKQLLQIELATLSSLIGRNDILSQLYKNASAGFDETLRPIEAALSQIPFTEFKACPGVMGTFGDIQNIYFEKKNEIKVITYKYAQLGFASTYFEDLRNKIENNLIIADKVIEYLDSLATGRFSAGNPVTVYTTNKDAKGNSYPITRKGTVVSVSGIYVTIAMTDTGKNETFDASEVQAG